MAYSPLSRKLPRPAHPLGAADCLLNREITEIEKRNLNNFLKERLDKADVVNQMSFYAFLYYHLSS